MPKYYCVCEATPSVRKYRKNEYLRIFQPVCEGFLFHDTENTIGFDHVRKAIWKLAPLFEGARTVIAVRVNANTIMATFDTRALPKPSKPDAYYVKPSTEYLSEKQLSGWILPDIHDQETDAQYLVFDQLYAECTMLERFTDACPCPRIGEGTCFPDTVYTKLPWLTERTTAFPAINTSTLKTKTYKTVDGFEYISGQYAATDDFTEAVRPWDNYDFTQVESRKRDFAERGAVAARHHAHRKAECAQCVFSVKDYKNIIHDCGRIRSCNTHSTEQEAWDALYHWLSHDTFYLTGDSNFTLDQINYLISVTGEEYLSKALTQARLIPTYLAGFSWSSDATFKVVPVKGRLNRERRFKKYSELREYFPQLPAPDSIPKVDISLKTRLAYAILSKIDPIRSSGHQPHPAYRLGYEDRYVTLWGHTSVSSFAGIDLHKADHVMKYVNCLYPNQYHTIAAHSKTPWPTEQSPDTRQLPQLVLHHE